MWPVYARGIQAAVGARLDEEAAERLADLLARLIPANGGTDE